jgi:hypothetical protein
MDPRIYLFWQKQNKKTLILSAFFILAVVFALFSTSWGLSWWAGHQYRTNWSKLIPRDFSAQEYVFVVVLGEQQDYLFKRGRLLKHYRIATGSPVRFEDDRRFHSGLWRLNGRIVYSPPDPLYGARLIFLEYYDELNKKFVRTERAFHGTSEEHNIGHPTSMGCVYHRNRDIVEIYDLIPDNVLVVVTPS